MNEFTHADMLAAYKMARDFRDGIDDHFIDLSMRELIANMRAICHAIEKHAPYVMASFDDERAFDCERFIIEYSHGRERGMQIVHINDMQSFIHDAIQRGHIVNNVLAIDDVNEYEYDMSIETAMMINDYINDDESESR